MTEAILYPVIATVLGTVAVGILTIVWKMTRNLVVTVKDVGTIKSDMREIKDLVVFAVQVNAVQNTAIRANLEAIKGYRNGNVDMALDAIKSIETQTNEFLLKRAAQ